jgi:hypothetical protein
MIRINSNQYCPVKKLQLGTTDRAAEIKDILSYPKMDSSTMEFGVNMLVSLNSKSVIQYIGGHVCSPFDRLSRVVSMRTHVHLFFKKRLFRMNSNYMPNCINYTYLGISIDCNFYK